MPAPTDPLAALLLARHLADHPGPHAHHVTDVRLRRQVTRRARRRAAGRRLALLLGVLGPPAPRPQTRLVLPTPHEDPAVLAVLQVPEEVTCG